MFVLCDLYMVHCLLMSSASLKRMGILQTLEAEFYMSLSLIYNSVVQMSYLLLIIFLYTFINSERGVIYFSLGFEFVYSFLGLPLTAL